jgi:RNA polymerase sigma factor (sigma-70 family)
MRLLKDRALRPQSPIEESGELADRRASQDFDVATMRVDLDRALGAGSVAERRVLYLRYQEDLATREIARLLNLNETTARVQLHRALRGLRDRLSA